MSKLNQYEFSIEIDEYIFERFVQNKVRDEYKDYKVYKKNYPNTKCNFIINLIIWHYKFYTFIKHYKL